jgi:hypothetical protein
MLKLNSSAAGHEPKLIVKSVEFADPMKGRSVTNLIRTDILAICGAA